MDPIHWFKILYDFSLLLIMFAMFLFLKYFVDPVKTGFYCNDYSINMPFRNSTFPNSYLIATCVPFPLSFMILTEFIRTLYMKTKHSKLTLHNKYKIIFLRGKTFDISEQMGNILISYVAYLFGLLCNFIITLIGKNFIGRLRPNFLDVCKPIDNPYTTYCNTQVNGVTYLIPDEHFKCGSNNLKDVNESRKSFPSGHASTSFYTAIFLILYINKFWTKRNIGFVPQFFQFLLFSLAWFISLSRVTDNKHHPTDVLAGSVLGTLIALFTFYYLNSFFKRYNFRLKYDRTDLNRNDINLNVLVDQKRYLNE